MKLVGRGSYGHLYRIKGVSQESFLHLTKVEFARQILKTRRLLLISPAYAVYAISTRYGRWAPSIQIARRPPLVGILFHTDTKPKVGYPEEVLWEKEVFLTHIEALLSLAAVKDRLQSSPFKGEWAFEVRYE